MASLCVPPTPPRIVLFPFMSKGHTIPTLHLARLLIHRSISVTIFTTPANKSFISEFLANTNASIIDLPFPEKVPNIPKGIESTDKLPSMSLFIPFTLATKLIQPHFEQALENLPNVTCIISDGFLPWTFESASKFGIPRLSFYGMNNYAMTVYRDVGMNNLLTDPELNDDDEITLTSFPWIKLTRNDFDAPFNQRDPKGPHWDFIIETGIATMNSYGMIVNSFYELEPIFHDYSNRNCKPKAWCIGPLNIADTSENSHKSKWIKWLDKKLENEESVLYVAFGSQAEISTAQLCEITKGLEESNVNFLWVVRMEIDEYEILEGKVGDRGMVVREWVDQREILEHGSVKGFLSHCGWNSVMESICAKVPILAWPMMAEQHLNARMVVEEIKIGLRVETENGSVRGFVKSAGLVKMVRELMEGDKGKEVRDKVILIGEDARKAMAEGGSSWLALNQLIHELHLQLSGR